MSYFAVQPWMNVADLGFAAVAISDRGSQAACSVARELAGLAWDKRHAFDVDPVSTDHAIGAGQACDGGPVLLVDASDCVGGGGTGESAVVLEALLKHAPDQTAAALIVDPECAEAAWSSGESTTLSLSLGNSSDQSVEAPLDVEAKVVRLFDGAFAYSGGIMAGDNASMGRSAWLRIGNADVVVASNPTYEYADEQFRTAGFDASERKFIVVKNPMNYQQAFPCTVATFLLDTPGPTTPVLKSLHLPKVQRPLFPFDTDLSPDFAVLTRASETRTGAL